MREVAHSPVSSRYQNPALAVDAVWIERGRVLLVERGHAPFRGMRALPGGFVEQRETVEAAVVREVWEETGLRVRPSGLVGVYSGPDRDPRKPCTSVVFFVRGRSRAPRGGDDAAAASWVPLAQVGPLAFDHSKILADARRILRARRRRRTSRQ
jgi:8-oxo-dGTP diphosphatase